MTLETFVYDRNISFSKNFERWYHLNCNERNFYKDRLYTPIEAEKVFNKLYPKCD